MAGIRILPAPDGSDPGHPPAPIPAGSRLPHLRDALQGELDALACHLEALGPPGGEGGRIARTLLAEFDALAAWTLGYGGEAPGAEAGARDAEAGPG